MEIIRFFFIISLLIVYPKKILNQELKATLLLETSCVEKTKTNYLEDYNHYLSFKPKSRILRKQKILYFHGFIDNRLLSELKKEKTSILILNSSGGLSNPTKNIAKFIHENNISTYVPPLTKCSSACAILWASGTYRALGLGSSLMFHAPRIPSFCFYQNKLYKEANGDYFKLSKKIKKLKRNLSTNDNYTVGLLMDWLGVEFIDWYLVNREKIDPKEWGNLLRTRDVEISANEAFNKKYSHQLVGSMYENYIYIKNIPIKIKFMKKKEIKFRNHIQKNYVSMPSLSRN
jgi:ATP-dependent protease ClpP protease subunit